MKYLFFIILLTGCVNAKKASRFMNEHPEVLAPICAEKYPVKDSVVKGDSVILYDTLWGLKVQSDTVVTRDTVRITNTLPAKVITKTVHRVDTVIRENTAKWAACEAANDECTKLLLKSKDMLILQQSQINNLRKLRNKWRLWVFILIGAGGMFTFLKIKKIL